ncbi:hypothetical protein KGM_212843 [Danaus plexippus plexippus]|uniref:Uncharacterized protein n=1 Tax=Danaus plexippus plexippus TaxID=278856 RepID=A0A212EGY2_DANPL|nr:hypothetical protein KGM_212843 [Danaus plexippus plexippus]
MSPEPSDVTAPAAGLSSVSRYKEAPALSRQVLEGRSGQGHIRRRDKNRGKV